MPIDSLSEDTTISSWNLFVAAMTSNQGLRSDLISRVHNRASFNVSAGVFPLSYDSTHGSTIMGVASPAQGAMYAPLALAAPVVQITVNATSPSPSPSPSLASSKATSYTGAIAGGIAGGVAALILLVGTIAFVRRRRRQDDPRKLEGESFSGTAIDQMAVTPFNPARARTTPVETGSPAWTTSDGLFSSSEPTLSPSQIAAPTPVGLTDKELARLRSTPTLSPLSHAPPSHAPPSHAPPSHAPSSSSGSQPTSRRTVSTTDQATVTPTPETRRLQTEVESLRREMQQLRVRAERFEAPPSYGHGGDV
jgi:hypothetical protein